MQRHEDTAPWYEAAFGQDYLDRYPHRDASAASGDLPFLAGALGVGPDALVLDLCCGAGRYANALSRGRLRVVGLDLSHALLRSAHAEPPAATRVRGDMRALPFRDGVFDGIVNLFTSFGYFESEAENLAVLRESVRVLRSQGTMVLDFFNKAFTLATLEPRSERVVGGQRVTETRAYNARTGRLEKAIRVHDGDASVAGRELVESVRAYSADELATLAKAAGLTVRQRFGDLRGSSFNEQTSDRCVLVAKK